MISHYYVVQVYDNGDIRHTYDPILFFSLEGAMTAASRPDWVQEHFPDIDEYSNIAVLSTMARFQARTTLNMHQVAIVTIDT